MRAWPPIQILLVLLLLGGAAWMLRYVGRGIPETIPVFAEVDSAHEVDATIDLWMESTVPLRIDWIRWGSTALEGPPESIGMWSTRFSSTDDGPFFIEGTVEGGSLPAALRVEIERHGFPGVESIQWIRTNPFTVVIATKSK